MQASSRILELVDAAIARGDLNPQGDISPNLPLQIRELIIANAITSLVVLFAAGEISPKAFKHLKNDIDFLLLATVGREFLASPSFQQAYKIARDDSRDTLRQSF